MAELVSIVVPIMNERDNVAELVQGVEQVMQAHHLPFELIAVDDGSTDDTLEVLCRLQKERPYMRVIQLRRNFGQTAAMSAGFNHAHGAIIVPIDGDLQNDPADIPRLVDKLNQGYDVVSGWRRHRQDTFLTRKLPSRIANYLIGRITGVRLHDYGCTLKAYHREVVNHLNLYGEMHRFLPAVAAWSGARVTEMEVNHRPRLRGRTKYGLNRTFKVVLDLITIKFLGQFSTKPLHIFGGIGLATLLLSFITGATVVYQKFFSGLNMNRNPLLVLTAMLIMMSVQFLLMGLLAEMLCRTYHESQNKPTYVIRRIFQSGAGGTQGQSDG